VGIRGPVPYLAAVGFSALGFLPAVVIHSVLRSGNDGIHSAMKALLVGTAYATSTIAAVLHIHSLLNGAPVPSVLGMRLLTYVCGHRAECHDHRSDERSATVRDYQP
jgi:hypothetical protein